MYSVRMKNNMFRMREPGIKTDNLWKHFCGLLVLSLAITSFCFFLPLQVSAATIAAGETLTLQRAIDIALKNQPSILAGQSTVRANEATIGQARANYYPEITASGSYNRSYSETTGTTTGFTKGTSSTTTSTYRDQYTSSVGLSQMIFDFGKTPTQVRINTLNTESSRLDLDSTINTVIFNVKQAYYNVLQAQRNRNVAEETVKKFEQQLEQAQGFYTVGKKAKIEVTKAEVDLSNAKLSLIKSENQVRLSRVTLNNAMGIPNVPDYTLEDNLLYAKYGLLFEDALSKVYAQRPDLQSLIMKKEAAKESVNLAQKGYFPVISGSANYSYSGSEFPLNNGWNYGLNISIPLFSGFETKYRVAQAQANYDAITANEQSLRLDIYSQVQQAYLSLRLAEESMVASELAVKQAKENVELATGRYQAGVGSPLEVTDALVGLNNAQVAYTQALTDYKNAQASIEKAIGVRE